MIQFMQKLKTFANICIKSHAGIIFYVKSAKNLSSTRVALVSQQ